jgi:hypothetical protein
MHGIMYDVNMWASLSLSLSLSFSLSLSPSLSPLLCLSLARFLSLLGHAPRVTTAASAGTDMALPESANACLIQLASAS